MSGPSWTCRFASDLAHHRSARGGRGQFAGVTAASASSSVALGVLIKAVVRIKPDGGRMALFGFTGRTLPAFRPPASLYGELWTECASVAEAIAAVTPAPPAN